MHCLKLLLLGPLLLVNAVFSSSYDNIIYPEPQSSSSIDKEKPLKNSGSGCGMPHLPLIA